MFWKLLLCSLVIPLVLSFAPFGASASSTVPLNTWWYHSPPVEVDTAIESSRVDVALWLRSDDANAPSITVEVQRGGTWHSVSHGTPTVFMDGSNRLYGYSMTTDNFHGTGQVTNVRMRINSGAVLVDYFFPTGSKMPYIRYDSSSATYRVTFSPQLIKKVEYIGGLEWRDAIQMPYPANYYRWVLSAPSDVSIWLKGYTTYAVFDKGNVVASGSVPENGIVELNKNLFSWGSYYKVISVVGDYQPGVSAPSSDWWDIPIQYNPEGPYGYFVSPGPNWINYNGGFFLQGSVQRVPIGYWPVIRIEELGGQNQKKDVAVPGTNGVVELDLKFTRYGDYRISLLLQNLDGNELMLYSVEGKYMQFTGGDGGIPPVDPNASLFEKIAYYLKLPFVYVEFWANEALDGLRLITSGAGAMFTLMNTFWVAMPEQLRSPFSGAVLLGMLLWWLKR